MKRTQEKPQAPREQEGLDLDQPLIGFTPADMWSIRHAIQGTFITGSIGSGKTSGSGAQIARSFLANGFGGLVLTATAEEKGLWQRYARETGREDSLVVFGPGHPWRFDFLRYETARPGAGAGHTENIVKLFTRLSDLGQRSQGQSNEGFWQRSLEQMLRSAIDLLFIARGTLSLPDLYELVTSAPTSPEELRNPAWQQQSLCYRLVAEGENREKTTRQAGDFDMAARYWFNLFPGTAEKTRSIFVASFTSIADGLLRGVMRELFSGKVSVVPELSQQGAVILLDLPVMEFGYVGQLAQVLFKETWQAAMRRRDVKENPRPVFLWADECQYFVSTADADFQNTARHSHTATVFLTQNLPNLFSAFPGHASKETAQRFTGCLNTKIWHANGCTETNEWAAETIGKDWIALDSWNASSNARGESSPSVGESKAFEYVVPPQTFTSLRTGGPQHDHIVDAFIFQSGGRRWTPTGKPWLPVSFDQRS